MKAVPSLISARVGRFAAWCFVFFCFGAAPSLRAQQAVPLTPGAAQPVSDLEGRQVELALEDQPLAAIIAALAAQIGHGIVLDGKPVKAKASVHLHTSAKAALDQVAESFDCSWKLGKSGAVLMSKRFHTPGDLPQIHLKEMQQMAADLLTIWPENASQARMESYPFVTMMISPGNALLRTMNGAQMKLLNDGKPLTLQDLSGEQQQIMRLVVAQSASGTTHDIWEALDARLAKMAYSSLQWRSWYHNRLDKQPTPFQYSLKYIWPDLQDRGYHRLVPASKFYTTTGEKPTGGKAQ